MDKKKKRKWISAICFVTVCGTVCLGIRYGGREKEQIVMKKQEETEKFREAETEKIPEVTTAPKQDDNGQGDLPVEIYVHMCGAVVKEGVYVLPRGCRVADGVEAAGGFTEHADTAYHNLASGLSDGQKVYVPTLEETRELSAEQRLAKTEESEESVSGPVKGAGKVNINTADAGKLMTLDGIGEAKAMRILEYREKVGAFQSIDEIKNVSGIGDAMFERIKEDIVAE